MILIGLGSNVEGPWGSPEETIREAVKRLDGAETRIVKASRLLSSKPVGPIEQDDYINGAAILETALTPEALMKFLHELELEADRRRTVRWGPRTLDIDLLDYNGIIRDGDGDANGHRKPLILPHPAIAERAFVLAPVCEIAPDWRHPQTRKTAAEMLTELDESSDAFHFIEENC
jgi:2-amino-4-hydroxy-6-hydroxymethyldihydropteridine diphosphokinase